MVDTIAAVSSAAGSAARAIVRLSGPRAWEIAAGLLAFPPGAGAGAMPATAGMPSLCGGLSREGTCPGAMPAPQACPPPARGFSHTEAILDIPGIGQIPAGVLVFLAPASYTRQDLVELHIPGPACLASAVWEGCLAGGARPAEAGEFTARAMLSGRIDLSAAQAVADVIAATSRAELRSASRVLGGRVARLCRRAADELTDALASVEASIDLAEEGIQLAAPADLGGDLEALAGRLTRVAQASADRAEVAASPTIALAGRPNAGKSSLLNALAGVDRAMVSAMANTTRDVLSASIELPGGRGAVLMDLAGLGAPGCGLTDLAHGAARSALASADAIVLAVPPDSGDLSDAQALLADLETLSSAPRLVAATKADLAGPGRAAAWALARRAGCECLDVSARTGQGIGPLREALGRLLGLHAQRGGGTGLHRRQRLALLQSSERARSAADLLAGSDELADAAELVAFELRGALSALADISGQVTDEEILGSIFRRFCVGK